MRVFYEDEKLNQLEGHSRKWESDVDESWMAVVDVSARCAPVNFLKLLSMKERILIPICVLCFG
jgi:hypothetical protein